MNAKRVAIYGSCVTRDSVPQWSDDLEMVCYVARQSVISAAHPVHPRGGQLRASHVPIGWRRAQFLGDFAGTAPGLLVDSRPDLVVWDLTDERSGVARYGAGGWFTRSKWEPATHGDEVAFGTDEHFDLWSDSLEQVAAVLDEHGLLARSVVNATRWAAIDTSGAIVHADQAGTWNKAIARYYAEFDRYAIPLVRATMPVADEASQWGPAPFHYDEDTHASLAGALEEFLG